jgi:thioredoxin-related protein
MSMSMSMTMTITRPLVLLLALSALPAQNTRPQSQPDSRPDAKPDARRDGWLTDYQQARRQAKAEGKDLLLDFTGSDCCVWCIRLRKEVFDMPSFRTKAPQAFVLVEVDFPRAKQQSDTLRKQNRRLQQTFAVDGYPTIYLADADGRPYARTGYDEVGPEIYLGRLVELREKIRKKRDAAFQQAGEAEGAERARHLAAGLRALQPGIPLDRYLPVIDEILRLDPEDKQGLKTHYSQVKKRIALAAAMRVLSRQLDAMAARKQWPEVVAAVEKFRKDKSPSGNILQQLLWIQAMAHFEQDQKEQAVAKFEEVQKLDPESDLGKQAAKAIQVIGKSR